MGSNFFNKCSNRETMKNHHTILIGTCGWSYGNDWRGVFYPPKMKENEFLAYYSQQFSTVEIDSSFYRIPTFNMVQAWDLKTPANFKFSGKIPQDITHKAKLNLNSNDVSIRTVWKQYSESMLPLEKSHKILAHLLQLPPSFSLDSSFLYFESFLNYWNLWRETEGKDLLGSQFRKDSWRMAVEFRHLSWMTERVFELLRRNNVVYCAVIEPLLPPRMDITNSDLTYVRFHGYGKNPWWNYQFSQEELDHWAQIIQESVANSPHTTHAIYFNNHFSGYAVKNAGDLIPKLIHPSQSENQNHNQDQNERLKSDKRVDKKTSRKTLDFWTKSK